ncbi:surfeit locus protein 5 subunit 22 of mediator complex-domain-containing protein [Gilbertella persicaria]|uniref:Mediator of RNA polymerase II transcription subunit 22 n=1 Tax=Rhizopus stolonifer TaxID=4846 RepID=A0A367KXC9_RHIST|nr:surfeit locus protein 5 subunit 22 of mediator complex-domain-containing protein [Gilbertella persicaria]KAI8092167.1 surfeit locus protein 5 subunit 22 of mediator complex-domain-containing protein [Gilbertella persicaria]RCI06869.1 Mediator of RNA polymerase II transcription subunit 22 [Rhizopus stolonifer]
MATLPPFAGPSAGPRPVLLQIEDQYNKRIDDDVAKLVDCFTDIVKVGENKDKDKFKVAQEGYQIESQAAQIVRSCESLLSLVGELKQSLLLNDTKTLSKLRQARSEKLTENTVAIKERILTIKKELADTVYDLESVYYRSLTD